MDYIDFPLDDKLNEIKDQNEKLDEFIDPSVATNPWLMGAAAGISSALIIGKLISFLWTSSQFKKALKVDKKLSKRINEILGTSSKWIVHQYPDRAPNAFAIGGNDIFITTGLTKLLTDREVEAVMLHEAFHNKDLHIWKSLVYESSFTYLIVYTSMVVNVSLMIPFVAGFMVAWIMRNVTEIVYKRIMGRRHENKADEFAIKYGYGSELISSLNKMEDWAKRRMGPRKCGRVCQIVSSISDAIDEHPSTKKRIETILKKSKELNRAMNGGPKVLSKFVAGVFKNNG